MDTCTNCGATLRPGAKFCTTCGTRLNDMPPASTGWGTPPSPSQEDSQETTVLNAVQPPSKQEKPSSIREQQADGGWSTAFGRASSEDPASRFISALDDDVQPVDEEGASSADPASTWNTAPPAFTPPPPSNWSYSTSGTTDTGSSEIDSEDDTNVTSTWGSASTWGAVQTTDESAAGETEVVNSAGSTDDGVDEVDSLSGDEIDVSGESSHELAPDEARDKAIELADELRRTIRMIGGGGESDHGAAVMALTEASLGVGDFSDVRGVIADVKNDPRDIQTLGELAGKVDRIEALLDDHRSLTDAIESAIKELNGF